jgi:hypothetical protein
MDIQKAVIPAKAGIQLPRDRLENWIPAFAGMTSRLACTLFAPR